MVGDDPESIRSLLLVLVKHKSPIYIDLETTFTAWWMVADDMESISSFLLQAIPYMNLFAWGHSRFIRELLFRYKNANTYIQNTKYLHVKLFD